MHASNKPAIWMLICLPLSAAMIGCSGRPSRIGPPGWDPDGLTEKAMELYDANGDGKIDEQELAKAPGLAFALERMDNDGDGALSEAELIKRFELYEEMGTGLRSQSVRIKINGRPVRDAPVRFVPEAFLEGVIGGAEGVTNREGVVTPRSKTENLRAMQNGFYRVEVDSPDMKNADSAVGMGLEVSPVSESEQTGSTLEVDIQT